MAYLVLKKITTITKNAIQLNYCNSDSFMKKKVLFRQKREKESCKKKQHNKQ